MNVDRFEVGPWPGHSDAGRQVNDGLSTRHRLRHDPSVGDVTKVLVALEAFIEKDMSVDEITGLGFDRATVIRVLQMVKHNEYKRRQAPPGIRISSRAFGRDWRYPITSWYRFPG